MVVPLDFPGAYRLTRMRTPHFTWRRLRQPSDVRPALRLRAVTATAAVLHARDVARRALMTWRDGRMTSLIVDKVIRVPLANGKLRMSRPSGEEALTIMALPTKRVYGRR